MPTLRFFMIGAALLAATLASAQTTYRWIDKDTGKTVFSDLPPPRDAKQVVKQTGAQRADDQQLPYATRQAAEKFPVTLYTAASCVETCQQARSLLTGRGVPFAEKAIKTDEDIAELAKILGGKADVPSLSVGQQRLSGLANDAWNNLLDLAGYPKSAPYGASPPGRLGQMKIAAWNVNSLKVRLPQLLEWLAAQRPDVVCLQETKLEDHNFPQQEIEAAGYQVVCSGQKTYNGVALLARETISDVVCGNPLFPDPQKRLIAATVGGVRIICAYVPNGQAVGSDKYAYKLAWLDALHEWLGQQLEQLGEQPRLALAGDFNIAPEDRDVHDPAAWVGKILCSDDERAAFQRLLALGLKDSFRLFEQAEKNYSWWDYRMLGFQRNQGLRIDHILLSAPLAERCSAAGIDREMRKRERPSDHAPVSAEISD